MSKPVKPKRVRRWSLQRYLLAIVALMVLTQVISVGLIVRAGLGIAEESASEGTRAAATAAAKNVELTFDFARQLVVAGSKRPGLIQFLEAGDEAPVQEVLDVILRDTPYYSTVYALSPELSPVRGAPRAPVPAGYQQHLAAFRQALAGREPFVSPVVASSLTGEPVVIVAAAAVGPHGVVGLLVGEISLRKVARDVLSLRYGEAGFAQLVTQEGQVLSGDSLAHGTVAPLLQRHFENDGPNARMPFRSDRGEPMVASWVRIDPWGWRVVVVEPETQAESKVHTLKVRTLGLAAVGLLLVLGAGFLLLREVGAPLRRATLVASRISGGELDQRMPDSPIEELSVLSQAFNEMTHRLGGLLDEVRGQNRDLEERVAQRTREFAEARNAAETASRAKGEFLANLSHEVRTPLNGVLGMCELLLESDLTAEQRDSVQTLTTSAEVLLGIIDDLLDVSKAEAGKLELEAIEFDAGRVVEEVAAFLAPQAFKKGLEVLVDADRRLGQPLKGDPNRLRQVLLNLVGNAVKFTDRGTVSITAVLEDGEDEAHAALRFEVADTGVGIAPGAEKKLFTSFTQVDASTTRRFGGTGLGLAISARLVELMGGRIGVDSAPGMGSRFWFRVRFERLPGRPPSVFGARVLAGRRALCVDGHAGSRRVIEKLLADEGLTTALAADASAALELARTASSEGLPFDIAVVDAGFFDADESLLTRLRALPGLAQLPLVVLAGRSGAGFAQRTSVPLVVVLSKPVRRATLRFSLLRALLPEPTPDEALPPPHEPVDPSSAGARRVLVVEDDSVSRKVVVTCLTSLGYLVDTATDGREAVRKADRGGYDGILMDCHMPEMDGFEATRCIRRLEEGRGRRVPIIALTARVLTHHRDEVLSAGMDDYLTKPVSRASLRETLGALFSPLKQAPATPREPPLSQCELDPEALEELRFMAPRGVPLVTQTAEELLGALPLRLSAIEAACSRGDASALCLQAHSLKAAVACMGARRAASLCAQLEGLGEVGRARDGRELMGALQLEARALVSALEQLIEREKSRASA